MRPHYNEGQLDAVPRIIIRAYGGEAPGYIIRAYGGEAPEYIIRAYGGEAPGLTSKSNIPCACLFQHTYPNANHNESQCKVSFPSVPSSIFTAFEFSR